MNAKQVRKALLYVHLVVALYIGYYVYSPIHEHPLLQILGRWVFFPIMLASGVAMWQWAWIRKRQARRARERSGAG